jgi:hypothetical protein
MNNKQYNYHERLVKIIDSNIIKIGMTLQSEPNEISYCIQELEKLNKKRRHPVYLCNKIYNQMK